MLIRRKYNHTRRKRNRGVSVVEAAVVLPVVVLLLFGFLELGWKINAVQALHSAARQGARAAVRLENSNAEVRAAVLDSLSKSFDVPPEAVTERISKLDSNGEEEYQVMSLDDNERGDPVRVTVTVDYSEIRLPLPSDFLGLGSGAITSSAVMRRFN
jgi:Flp pilus assembly protein TadG